MFRHISPSVTQTTLNYLLFAQFYFKFLSVKKQSTENKKNNNNLIMIARLLEILRSAECAKCIGWLKFISSIVITLFLVLVLIFFSSIAETIKKNINSSSNTKFYVFLGLFMIFLIAYAACSFVLIIGTINHDRLKVLTFVAADVIFTFMLIYGFIKLFPSTFFIILLLLQLISLYSVIEWTRALFHEYSRRREIEEERKRVEQAKESFQNEIKQYHARIKIEDEQQARD